MALPDVSKILETRESGSSEMSTKKAHDKSGLNPILKDGSLVGGGRLENACIKDGLKHRSIRPYKAVL